MSEKRMFQVFDEMNVNDDKNNTATIGVCNQVTYIQSSKKGTLITMGAPKEALFDIESGKVIPLLILLNKSEYDKLKTP